MRLGYQPAICRHYHPVRLRLEPKVSANVGTVHCPLMYVDAARLFNALSDPVSVTCCSHNHVGLKPVSLFHTQANAWCDT